MASFAAKDAIFYITSKQERGEK